MQRLVLHLHLREMEGKSVKNLHPDPILRLPASTLQLQNGVSVQIIDRIIAA
jgi:hypothetical protein